MIVLERKTKIRAKQFKNKNSFYFEIVLRLKKQTGISVSQPMYAAKGNGSEF